MDAVRPWGLLPMLALGLAACAGSNAITPSPAVTPTVSPAPTATLTPTPAPTPVPVFGMHVDSGVNQEGLAQAGGLWLRGVRLLWQEVEPNPGDRHWPSGIDDLLSQAAMRNLKPMLMVSHAPVWARKYSTGASACGPIAQESLDDFGQFMFEVVQRYSYPPYNVVNYEIWNEPDVDGQHFTFVEWFGCWGDITDEYYGGGYFAEMLKAVYPRIKQANPAAQVHIGGLLSYCNPALPGACDNANPAGSKPYNFFEGILRNGGGDYFDVLNFTAYDRYAGQLGQYEIGEWGSRWNMNGPVLGQKAQFFRDQMTAYGITGKALMATEIAVLCGNEWCTPDAAYETTKAYYVAQAYATALQSDVLAGLWYTIEGWNNSGLLDANGQPNQAHAAYEFASQVLMGKRFVREVTDYVGVRVYEFTGSGGRAWVLWSLDGDPHPITLPSVPPRLHGVSGISLTAAQDITITLEPWYIEWGP